MTKYYYGPSSKGFYNTDVHSKEQIPADAVGISNSLYETLRDGQSGLKRIEIDKDGMPALVDVADQDDERAADEERYWRDTEIESIKWLRERHRDETEQAQKNTLTVDQYKELLAYIQTLRDWPQLEGFPGAEHRPVAPPWIAEHIRSGH
ncbi:phage tail assembly chaperone [Pseudomonas sp. WS 5532]|uniref:phage tail assembly chaperone n=1 Tax=Pseudomonas sp. WS 5532 TaxID=2717495 RepID=UPI0021CCED94|nr:phage tail assembly chaperone [Pseudomonas sp. WS 5532]